MSLAASASPRRASLDSDIILISTSPLPAPPPAPRRHRQHALQPPTTTTTTAAPPARSSSPRHHAYVSSAPANTITSPPSHLSNPISPRPPPRRHHQHSPSQRRSDAASVAEGRPSRTLFSEAMPDDRPSIINELIRNQFSHPHAYPSIITSPPPPRSDDDDLYHDDSHHDPDATTTSATTTTQTSDCTGRRRADDAAVDSPDSPSQQFTAGPSANTTQNTDFSLPETQLLYDPLDDQGNTETAATSFSEHAMPPATRLQRRDSGIAPPLKGRQSERAPPPLKQETATKRKKPLDPDDDIFGDLLDASVLPAGDDEGLMTIDLTEATEVPAELTKPIVDTRVKIAAFQCAICMDDVTGLTVTYCGHLFCAQCLHHSLDVGSTKGKCPMCRSKIDMKSRETYSSKTKGFWPLELKLMTTTRKGKRKADDISK